MERLDKASGCSPKEERLYSQKHLLADYEDTCTKFDMLPVCVGKRYGVVDRAIRNASWYNKTPNTTCFYLKCSSSKATAMQNQTVLSISEKVDVATYLKQVLICVELYH